MAAQERKPMSYQTDLDDLAIELNELRERTGEPSHVTDRRVKAFLEHVAAMAKPMGFDLVPVETD